MNPNFVIVLSIAISFLVSFSLLFLYFYLYDNGEIIPHYKKSTSDVNQSKIFLVGTSYVDSLNSEYIKAQLELSEIESDVFNLYNDGKPSEAHMIIESILNAKPSLVVLGVGYRDLGYSIENRCLDYGYLTEYKKENLDDVSEDFSEIKERSKGLFSRLIIQDIAKIIFPSFVIESNPKKITTDALKSVFEDKKKSLLVDKDGNRLELVDFEYQRIVPIEKLNSSYDLKFGVCLDQRDKEITMLRKNIKILKDNGIGVILFVPPYTKIALDAIPKDAKISFHEIMSDISEEFDIEMYDFSDKYQTKDIFADHTHIAKNNKAMTYSQDISKIILKQLDSNSPLGSN